jgi:hypothetical protein
MVIPAPVLDDLQKTIDDLVFSDGAWQTEFISGVGCFLSGATWNIRILLLKNQVPPDLQQYMNKMTTPPVTNETGPFSFLTGSGSGIRAGVGRGTLTAFVENNLGRFLMSCRHVLGAKATQVFDGTGNHIADTADWISFDREPIPADAGIAKLVSGLAITTGLPQFPGVTNKNPVELEMGAHVSHCGAVTRNANSVITDVRVTLKVDVGVERWFSNVALAEAGFAQKGDSGSLVIDTDQQRPAGVVFGEAELQNSQRKVAICSLGTALTKLAVSIV